MWAPLAAAVGFTVAQDSDDDFLGPSGANNRTTPTKQDGRITIHYVTVGKIEHEFQVGDEQQTSLLTSEILTSPSQTVSWLL